MLKLKNLSKFYYNKGLISSGITKVNLEFKIGEFVVITGESGSGKSTLLNVLSGLDSYEEGEMYINGLETSHYTEKEFEEYRRKYVSNIFQNFNLVNSYSVYQNVELVLLINGYNKKEIKDKVIELLKKVDMYKFRNTKASKLSGGQKQRVAIARALAKETPIIIADEPTGSLDSESASKIIELLSEISKDKLVIIVTHNYEQVEKYATRKVKMHDGKVLEDLTVKNTKNNQHIDIKEIKPISFISKLCLGIRNAFNVKIKFLLILCVYLFMIFTLGSEYANSKNNKYLDQINGDNYFINDTNPRRIIINKQDRSLFNNSDINKIRNIKGVDITIKNDLLLDQGFQLSDTNETYSLYGKIKDISTIGNNKLYSGRLPENDNEVLIYGESFDYYLSQFKDNLLSRELFVYDYNGSLDKSLPLKVVGIVINEEMDNVNYNSNLIFYVNGNTADLLNSRILINNTEITETINYHIYNYIIIPNTKVDKGEVYVNESILNVCHNFVCKDQSISIETKTIYDTNTLNLKITNIYNKDNIKNLLGITDYDIYKNFIYMNSDEYYDLFRNKNYQISVFVKEDSDLLNVNNELNKSGFNTLVVKETLAVNGIKEILGIFKTFFLAILLITLFFISYLIIKLVLKSRNVYYSTLRILGSNRKTAKQLLSIELITVSTVAFVIFILTVILANNKIISIDVKTLTTYLSYQEYIVLFVITSLMSYLISLRYALKLFKDTTMNTIREEV